MEKNYYSIVLANGVRVATTWEECKKIIDNFPNTKYKSITIQRIGKNIIQLIPCTNKVDPNKQNSSFSKEQIAAKYNLTKDQLKGLDLILSGKNCFITGAGGTGKSYLLKVAIREFKKQGKSVIIGATTSQAAINVGGRTLNHLFRLNIDPKFKDNYRPDPNNHLILEKQIKDPNKNVNELIRDADVIVIDEISSARSDNFSYVVKMIEMAEQEDKLYREKQMLEELKRKNIKKTKEEIANMVPLHKKQIIITGDLFQLGPIAISNEKQTSAYTKKTWRVSTEKGLFPNETIWSFATESWQKLNLAPLELKEIVRQKDKEFAVALCKIRLGDFQGLDYVQSHAKFSTKQDENNIHLSSYNKTAEQINRDCLKQVNGTEHIFKMKKSNNPNRKVKQADYQGITKNLHVKKGARVMSIINDSQNNKYQNGSQGIVTDISDRKNTITVLFDNGNQVIFNPHTWNIYDYVSRKDKETGKITKTYEPVAWYSQFPLKLAYAMSIHKSQGKTFDKMILDPEHIFANGQLYVALSRVKSVDNLYLTSMIPKSALKISTAVKDFYDNGYKYPYSNKKSVITYENIPEIHSCHQEALF